MFRGIGLGRELVNLTSEMVDIKYIEIISAMSKYNKFLDNTKALFVSNNLTSEKILKTNKVIKLFEQYNLHYEFISSPLYSQKIIDTIPNEELKSVIYPILRPNFFNNRARFKKYGIDFQTKKDFMNITLIPELLSLATWATTEYYIIENEK